jgi:hypothetical protein
VMWEPMRSFPGWNSHCSVTLSTDKTKLNQTIQAKVYT